MLHRLVIVGSLLLAGSLAYAEQGPPAWPPNSVPLVVRTPHHGFNRLLVSITVCEPGTRRCATIDDVMVDTGASGLRLDAKAVPSWLHLPAFTGPDGKPLAECLHFLHDVAWGPLRRVDLRIGGLTAADLPVQVIGGGPEEPDSCPHSDVVPTSNGTLGIGPHPTDCPGDCVQSADAPLVFSCGSAGDCTPLAGSVSPRFRLPNPVTRFPGYGNGIVVALPPAPEGGGPAVTGSLTFGVGTAANNRLGAARIVPLDRLGRFATRYRGKRFGASYIDSGTPTNLIPDPDLPRCSPSSSALCVDPERSLSAEIVGEAGVGIPVPFRVGSYDAVLRHGFGASDGAAAANDDAAAFVWGAPFFFGKRVILVMDDETVPGMPAVRGPFYAFETAP